MQQSSSSYVLFYQRREGEDEAEGKDEGAEESRIHFV